MTGTAPINTLNGGRGKASGGRVETSVSSIAGSQPHR